MRSDPKTNVLLGAISVFGSSSWPLLGPPLTEAYSHLRFLEMQKRVTDNCCNTGRETACPKVVLAPTHDF